jgi:hypothetical protein
LSARKNYFDCSNLDEGMGAKLPEVVEPRLGDPCGMFLRDYQNGAILATS